MRILDKKIEELPHKMGGGFYSIYYFDNGYYAIKLENNEIAVYISHGNQANESVTKNLSQIVREYDEDLNKGFVIVRR